MVYIPSLKKNILPGYVPPMPDELFSSWICRLAINHKIKPRSFIVNYFGTKEGFWNRDIDTLMIPSVIEFLVNHTPLQHEQIEKLFIKSYEGYVFQKCSDAGSNLGINALGIYHRNRKLFGLTYCPSCLRKLPAYYQKSWRLMTSIVCTECNLYLLDRCPKCNSPITFHRINIHDNTSGIKFSKLNICSNCKKELTDSKYYDVPNDRVLKYQKCVNEIIKTGYYGANNYSFSLVSSLNLLTAQLISTKPNNRFRSAMKEIFNRDFPGYMSTGTKNWNLELRKETLPYVFLIIQNPEKYTDIIRKHRVRAFNVDQDHKMDYRTRSIFLWY